MIKYSLVCRESHAFESWFQNGDAFDVQVKRGLVSCPVCGSAEVGKAIMAPAIGSRRRAGAPLIEASETAQTPAGEAKTPVALLDERQVELREMIRAFRQRVFAQAEDVGNRFPEEARKIHDGDIPDRPIHGQATLEEAKALLEEGIGILPLPHLPEEFN